MEKNLIGHYSVWKIPGTFHTVYCKTWCLLCRFSAKIDFHLSCELSTTSYLDHWKYMYTTRVEFNLMKLHTDMFTP